MQFPCAELNNKYILIRAGESYSESQDTILTNPAWKTSMAAGLSEKGKAQVYDIGRPHTNCKDISTYKHAMAVTKDVTERLIKECCTFQGSSMYS